MLFNQGRRSVLLLLCLLVVACGLFRTLRSEYIIFRNNNGFVAPLQAQSFTSRQGSLLYETVSKYQWPSVLAFYEQGSDAVKQELEETVLSSKPFAESRYICEKIWEEDTSLCLVWIPNVLYELFVIHYTFALQDMACLTRGVNFLLNIFGDRENKITKYESSQGTVNLVDTVSVAEMKQQLLHDVFIHTRWWKRAMAMITNTDATNPWVNIFLDINEFITTILHNYPVNSGTTAQQLAGNFCYDLREGSYETIALELIVRIMNSVNKTSFSFPYCKDVAYCLYSEFERRGNQPVLKPNSIIARTIKLELEAQKTNKALLFRGTSPIQHPIKKETTVLDSTLHMPEYKPRSVSYGNGLFAGCMFDPWGTPYRYMALESFTGYGLMINKLVTARNTDRNLFFIPPLSTLHGIFGVGQFFHPRTKAVLEYGACAQMNGVQHFWIRDDLGLIVNSSRSTTELEVMYLDLLSQNAVILSEPIQGVVVPEAQLKANMQQVMSQLREQQ